MSRPRQQLGLSEPERLQRFCRELEWKIIEAKTPFKKVRLAVMRSDAWKAVSEMTVCRLLKTNT